jgi:hypothetical protein
VGRRAADQEGVDGAFHLIALFRSLPHQMRQLRCYKIRHCRFDGIGGAGHGEDERLAALGMITNDKTCNSSAHHGRRLHVLITDQAKQFAESLQFDGDETAHDFDGVVAPRNARPAGDEDGVDGCIADPLFDLGRNCNWIIAHDHAIQHYVTRLKQVLFYERPAKIGVRRPCIRDGKDRALNRLAPGALIGHLLMRGG